MRKMSAAQRRRQNLLEELVKLCSDRGLGPKHLTPVIHDTCTRAGRNNLVSGRVKQQREQRAHRISAAGLMAQLSYLLEVWSERKLRAELGKMGGVLDAIVRHTSTSKKQLRADVGRRNVDVNGDVS